MLWRFFSGLGDRLSEWWLRSIWGWLVVIGPMVCYVVLLLSLDVFGLGASDPLRFLPGDAETAFRSPDDRVLYSVAGRLEYAIVCAVFFLVASFSILWSVPRILFAIRNPFGGITGILLSVGSSIFLFVLYINSEYNLRQVFADDILKFGEENGMVDTIFLDLNFFGLNLYAGETLQSTIMARSRDVIYALGNTAPWCLIVLAARCASFEPRKFRHETPASLRSRVAVLQITVVLAAANIVLSVAYTRAMTAWPPMLLEPAYAEGYAAAISRYVALWGALGSILLIAALAPAYLSLNRQFDRIATLELAGEEGRYVSYKERYEWRAKHGLIISAQQAMTAGAAVIAPIVTAPALEAAQGGIETEAAIVQELPFDER